MTLVRYRTGLRINAKCNFCGAPRKATVFQEGARWMAKMDCGHLGFRGWVRPPEELEKEGLVNAQTTEDPRVAAKRLQIEQDERYRAEERVRYELRKHDFTRSKYL